MAAKIDCDNALRRNTAAIQQSFMDGKISISDAKILYNRELELYANCRGGVSVSGFIDNQMQPSAPEGRYVTMLNGQVVFVPASPIVSTCRTCRK